METCLSCRKGTRNSDARNLTDGGSYTLLTKWQGPFVSRSKVGNVSAKQWGKAKHLAWTTAFSVKLKNIKHILFIATSAGRKGKTKLGSKFHRSLPSPPPPPHVEIKTVPLPGKTKEFLYTLFYAAKNGIQQWSHRRNFAVDKHVQSWDINKGERGNDKLLHHDGQSVPLRLKLDD